MQGAFHGRTMGAMALTSSKTFYRTGFAPLMPQAFIAPFPYCLHCKARQTAPDGKDWYKVSTIIIHIPWTIVACIWHRVVLWVAHSHHVACTEFAWCFGSPQLAA